MARKKQVLARCPFCRVAAFGWAHPPGTSAWALYDAQRDAIGAVILNSRGKASADRDKFHCIAPSRDGSNPGTPCGAPPAPDAKPRDGADIVDEVADEIDRDADEQAPDEPTAEASGDPLTAAIVRAVAPHLRAKVDADEVRKIAGEVAAQAIAEAVIPRKVETVIRVERPDGSQHVVKGEHTFFPLLLNLCAAREHSYLWGAPGGGKSTATAHVADALGLAYGYISLNPQTPDSKLLGYMDATGNYRRTVFRDCYEHGGVYCIDEMDNCSDSLLTTLNGALENGHGAFSDGVISRHPDFVCVATGNTAGRGSQAHAGRRPFDGATTERFVFVEWTYDEQLEESLTLQAFAGARPWLAWVRKVREHAKQHHPRLVASPRASIKGARLMAAGTYTDAAQLAEAVLFKGLDRDSVASILRAHPLPSLVCA
jgi:cobaltochelatase CobS